MASVVSNPTNFSYRPTMAFHSNNPNRSLFCVKIEKVVSSTQSSLKMNANNTTICSLSRRGPKYITNRRILEEKVEEARQLAMLFVNIIEAGFPAASRYEFEAVKTIADEVGCAVDKEKHGYVPVICGLARCMKNDIDAAWGALKNSKHPRIHLFIATSEIHIKYYLKKSKEEVIEIAASMVRYARSLGCEDVEFTPEDAGRSEKEFLYQILGEVIKAGATTLNIPYTDCFKLSDKFLQLMEDLKSNTPGIENVVISTHYQTDLGLATANTLEGAPAGAGRVEETINGIGEGAGNASTEEDAMFEHKETYKIMSPEDIGFHRSNESGIVLGKHSGRHALRARLLELDHNIDGMELDDLFWRFKAVAVKKKIITDDDLIALVSEVKFQVWKFGDMKVTSITPKEDKTRVKLIDSSGKEHVACSHEGVSFLSAFKAIDLIVKVPVILVECSLIGVRGGIDPLVITRVSIRENNETSDQASGTSHQIFSGNGSDADIVASCVRAYINALNKMLDSKKYSK